MRIVDPVSGLDRSLAAAGIPITEGRGWVVVELTHEQLRQLVHSQGRQTTITSDSIIAMLGAHDLVRAGLGDQALDQLQEEHEAKELGLVMQRKGRRRRAVG